MNVDIRVLGANDRAILARVAPGVFDHPVNPQHASEFLQDHRHHLVVALDDGAVVGFASGVHYVHPDKAPDVWINEIGVAPTHQRRGIATMLLRALCDLGRRLGCHEAWVLTDRLNDSASRLYEAVGGNASEQVMFTFSLSD